MNHVFVDFENVHQVDLTLIGAKAVSFTLMAGPKQTKLDSDLVEKLMAHSAGANAACPEGRPPTGGIKDRKEEILTSGSLSSLRSLRSLRLTL